MIISKIGGGLGNQMFHYAVGRRLSYHLNTEFKLDVRFFEQHYEHSGYLLNQFNIVENFATDKDFEYIKNKTFERGYDLGQEISYVREQGKFMPEVLNYPDDIYLRGHYQCEKYFSDIADVIKKDFTLKKIPNEGMSVYWKEKIISAGNSVSVHIRHGDYVLNPNVLNVHGILPISYYRDSLISLIKSVGYFTIFVFSDNIEWTKKIFKTDVPTEYIEGVESDLEEFYLMSLCKHNIIANSSFSWWSAWLNKNPNKKVFAPDPWFKLRWHNHDIIADSWTKISVDFNQSIPLDIKPFFSIVILVENNISTLQESFNSILSQDYRFYEVIIIDNVSNDNSDEFCQKVADGRKKFKFIKLYKKISKFAAYNIALNISQGNYILFLNGDDRLNENSLTQIYLLNESYTADVINSVRWFIEDENKNLITKINSTFTKLDGVTKISVSKRKLIEILVNQDLNNLLQTKFFKKDFLLKNNLKFNENISDEVELLFLIECFLKATNIIFISQAFYIEPKEINNGGILF